MIRKCQHEKAANDLGAAIFNKEGSNAMADGDVPVQDVVEDQPEFGLAFFEEMAAQGRAPERNGGVEPRGQAGVRGVLQLRTELPIVVGVGGETGSQCIVPEMLVGRGGQWIGSDPICCAGSKVTVQSLFEVALPREAGASSAVGGRALFVIDHPKLVIVGEVGVQIQGRLDDRYRHGIAAGGEDGVGSIDVDRGDGIRAGQGIDPVGLSNGVLVQLR